tara:strand:- start:257 stop:1372 length:1116 start_codon:yes stop_codon:yes gene_type:complete
MYNIYDFIVIGAGISACTFSTFLKKRFPEISILLVEHGRRIGGRATTRRSRKNKGLEFNHGLPSLSFSRHLSQDILTLIAPLLNSRKLVDISNNILLINESGVLSNALINDKAYRSLPFMRNFCEEIINQSTNPKTINFLFQTFTKSIKRVNDLWHIQVNNGRIVKSRNLILSSSLIAHPRCLEILKTNSIPLRDAFIPGEDQVVDSILKETSKLTYIKRKIYILYVSDVALVQNFNHQYLEILFSDVIRKDLNFEKIIFQRQSDGTMVILLHCSYINNLLEINFNNILKSLSSLFANYQIFLDLFLQSTLIDKMDWRASQPLNNLVAKELQWSSTSKIGFCGDWFNLNSGGSVESAMNSSIRLAKILRCD